jgi:hypothetical protein
MHSHFPKELEAIEGLTLIANNRVKAQIPDLLTELPQECKKTLVLPPFEPETPFDPLEIRNFPGEPALTSKSRMDANLSAPTASSLMREAPIEAWHPKRPLTPSQNLRNRDTGKWY